MNQIAVGDIFMSQNTPFAYISMRTTCTANFIVENITSLDSLAQKAAISCLKERVYGAILNRTKDAEPADELFQKLCVYLFELISEDKFTYEGENQFFRFMHTCWKRWWNKMNQFSSKLEVEELDLGMEENIIAHEEQTERLNALRACRAKIGKACLETIDLRINGASFKEILEELKQENLSVDTLRMRHHRCMKELKACVKLRVN